MSVKVYIVNYSDGVFLFHNNRFESRVGAAAPDFYSIGNL